MTNCNDNAQSIRVIGKQPAAAVLKPTVINPSAKAPAAGNPVAQPTNLAKPTIVVPPPKDETDEELSDLNSEDDSDGIAADDLLIVLLTCLVPPPLIRQPAKIPPIAASTPIHPGIGGKANPNRNDFDDSEGLK